MVENNIYKEALQRVISAVNVSNSSFLITGASGLIGSCLIDLLMLANEDGRHNHVYALGRSRLKLMDRFSAFVNNEYFHIIEQNVLSPLSDEYDFDYIIHGASNADPVSYSLYPVETMTTNLLGGYNILEYVRKHKDCKITILSTFEVYGNTGNDVYRESDVGIVDFNSLRSCYPESKRSLESLAHCYVIEHKIHANIARLCSIYGPTMLESDSKAHAQFIKNAIVGNNIVLKSKGFQRRTYCYVIDAVTGVLFVLLRGNKGESYNISNENAIASIAEVAHIVANIAGVKVVYELPSEIEAKGFSKPQNCILNNSKLKSLGWEGYYDVQKGLKETLSILNSDICRNN